MKISKRSIVFKNMLINLCGRVVVGRISDDTPALKKLSDSDWDTLILFIASVLFIELPEVFEDEHVDVGLRIQIPTRLMAGGKPGPHDLRAIVQYAIRQLKVNHPTLESVEQLNFTVQYTDGDDAARVLGKTAAHAIILGAVVMFDIVSHFVPSSSVLGGLSAANADSILMKAYAVWLGHKPNYNTVNSVYSSLNSFATSSTCVIDDSEDYKNLHLL